MAPAVFVWNEKEWVCDAIKIHKSNGGFSLAYSDGKSTEAKKKTIFISQFRHAFLQFRVYISGFWLISKSL